MEINIQSLLDVGLTSQATTKLNTNRAIDALLDIDSSRAFIDDEFIEIQHAINSVIEGDRSSGRITPTCHKAINSTLDNDTSKAKTKLNLIKALEDSFNVDNSKVTVNPVIYHHIEGTLDTDVATAAIRLNQQRAIASDSNLDVSKSQSRYLFLKNPPLPPIGSVLVRGRNKLSLKQSPTFIGNSTYVLDCFITGERLISLHLVFSIRSMMNGAPVVHLQKSTRETPNSYLQLTSGRGDILVQSITPGYSERGLTQELFATIMLLPHDFERLPNPSGTYLYDLWVYDLLGTNALIESGQIKVVSS